MIPEGWQEAHLRDMLEARDERSPQTDELELYSLTIESGVTPKTERYNREFLVKHKKKKYKKVYPGDLVYNPSNLRWGAINISKASRVVLVSPIYEVLCVRDPSQYDADFVAYRLMWNRQIQLFSRWAEGTLVERMAVKIGAFLSVRIAFPGSLAEQRAIADILGTWDEAIALTERRIEAARQRKKGLMQHLLTGRVRFPEFEGEEWQEARLGDLGETYSGLSGKSKDDFGQGKPYIPYLNIYENWAIDPEQMDYVSIKEGERQNRVRYGDFFFTTSSETPHEVGMSSVLLDHLEEVYLNSFCCGFRLKDLDTLLPEYAVYLLRGEDFRHAMQYLAQGATRYNLTKRHMLEAPLRLPPLAEQREIARVLSTCDREIALLTQKRDALQRQKKGLMQRLLTGRVRVKV